MNEKTIQLLDRTFNFGVDMLIFLNQLPYSPIFKVLILQLSRSSTSIGANYEEAQGASTKQNFAHRIGISYREARISVYWIRALEKLYTDAKFKLDFAKFKNEAADLN